MTTAKGTVATTGFSWVCFLVQLPSGPPCRVGSPTFVTWFPRIHVSPVTQVWLDPCVTCVHCLPYLPAGQRSSNCLARPLPDPCPPLRSKLLSQTDFLCLEQYFSAR